MRRIENKLNTNTLELWNDYYSGDKDTYRIKIYSALIPYFDENDKSVLDIGCGSGIGIDYIRSTLNINCHGCDFSDITISKAQEKYPEVGFYIHDILSDNLDEKYDVIIIAETLEHLEKPYVAIDKYLKLCNKLLISLPYREPEENDPEHLYCDITVEDFKQYSVEKFDGYKDYFRMLIKP